MREGGNSVVEVQPLTTPSASSRKLQQAGIGLMREAITVAGAALE